MAPAPSLCKGASTGLAEGAGDFVFKTGRSVHQQVVGLKSGGDIVTRPFPESTHGLPRPPRPLISSSPLLHLAAPGSPRAGSLPSEAA